MCMYTHAYVCARPLSLSYSLSLLLSLSLTLSLSYSLSYPLSFLPPPLSPSPRPPLSLSQEAKGVDVTLDLAVPAAVVEAAAGPDATLDLQLDLVDTFAGLSEDERVVGIARRVVSGMPSCHRR